MAKAPSSNRSIRLTDEAWAKLADYAKAHEISINAAVARSVAKLFAPGMAQTPAVTRAIKRNRDEATAQVGQTFSAGVQLGPSRAPVGSRLKGGKK